jgi:hypothetical protein
MAEHGHRLAGQRDRPQLVPVRPRPDGEGQVETARGDLLGQRLGTRLPQPDLDVGMAPPERREKLGHVHARDALLGAQGERAAQDALYGGHGVLRRAHLGEDPLGLAEQGAAGLRERDPTGGAHEQRA